MTISICVVKTAVNCKKTSSNRMECQLGRGEKGYKVVGKLQKNTQIHAEKKRARLE